MKYYSFWANGDIHNDVESYMKAEEEISLFNGHLPVLRRDADSTNAQLRIKAADRVGILLEELQTLHNVCPISGRLLTTWKNVAAQANGILVKLAGDENPRVRMEAARFAAHLDSGVIIALASDVNIDVRWEIAEYAYHVEGVTAFGNEPQIGHVLSMIEVESICKNLIKKLSVPA